jgi:galactonate dehydratase
MLQRTEARRKRIRDRLAAAARAAAAAPAAEDPRLAIDAIETFRVREPASGRAYTVVRLRTRSGLDGYGECSAAPAGALAAARSVLVGRKATAVAAARAALSSWPALRSAVEMALLDLVGKSAGAPVFQLLGGPTRTRARVMTPLVGDSDAALQAALDRARAAGVRAFSVPLPRKVSGERLLAAVLRRLEVLRRAGGDDSDFVLDGGGSLPPRAALRMAVVLAAHHLLWFEDPCAIASARRIAETTMSLGFGRTIGTASEFQDLLREQRIDVLRITLDHHGIGGTRSLAALAETTYAAVAPCSTLGPISTAAALHVAASLPNFFIVEIPPPASDADRELRGALGGPELERARDGFLPLPAEPGLGIRVDERVLERRREGAA